MADFSSFNNYQMHVVPRPLPPGLPLPARYTERPISPPRPFVGSYQRPLPTPSREVCEQYNRTANINLPTKLSAATNAVVSSPSGRHTRQRSRSIRGRYPTSVNLFPSTPHTVSHTKGAYDTLIVSEPESTPAFHSLDSGSKLKKMQLQDAHPLPVIVHLPSRPISSPLSTSPPPRKQDTAYRTALPSSPSTPSPRPPISLPPLVPAREARARLLASMLLKRFQGGRVRRSAMLPGGFIQKPSGLSTVSFPGNTEDDSQ